MKFKNCMEKYLRGIGQRHCDDLAAQLLGHDDILRDGFEHLSCKNVCRITVLQFWSDGVVELGVGDTDEFVRH